MGPLLFGPNANDLGMLNLITPEVVRRATAEEIREDVRIPLDLPLDTIRQSSYGRQGVWGA
ncbi:hypothetical protein BO70DRAFT_397150 [Aspergillus heteromorphus CBS 117.55]|uniref:Uncharacterized protein n=1 Tax=Aspergillus heteromorphus CBS 117.55 TaxID=1448321 RepID=A0A317W318_9EURO|nr:uncharacterized protein BO70DRAFT_397150 [Aspergillus heteromorphus CBS 117.55]PWY79672.1 hypothetical protein BO70DRAFT_397150 [Aspergillus heteromorphus CBS 117.55]